MSVKRGVLIATGVMLFGLAGIPIFGQMQNAEPKPAEIYQTLYLSNMTEAREMDNVVTDLRNLLPRAKVFVVPAAHAISLRGTPEEVATAQKILGDIDRPIKAYRLTYTIGGGDPAAQHIQLITSAGNKITLKQGSRVPIMTGAYTNASGQNQEVQYLDVGITAEASLENAGDRIRLRTKLEQSAVAEEKSSAGIQDPIIRQSVLESESVVEPGKPLVLGSVDMPGSGKHLEVSVLAELVK